MFCGKCGNQILAGAAFCANCGATVNVAPQLPPPPPSQAPFVPGAYPYATPGKRLVVQLLWGLAVGAAVVVTCGLALIGVLIWNIILWQDGLDIGKKFGKLRVVDAATGARASMSQMVKRSLLFQMLLAAPFYIAEATLVIADSLASSTAHAISLLPALLFMLIGIGLALVDSLWILRAGPCPQRLVDVWAKTTVVDENPRPTF